VVHCDLSPANIVVSWRGTAKIVDFGIARATIQLRSEDHTVAGKYNYMAPEQIRGERIDARADLFAFGVMLYELTVGKRLFRGRPEQVMRMVLEEEIPPPTALRPDFPARLAQIILTALERDPAKRYQTARQLHDDLLAWTTTSASQPGGKEQLARYLRSIFGVPKRNQADEFGDQDDPEEEELELERPLPGADAPVLFDAEDPLPSSPAPSPDVEPDAESKPVVVPAHDPPATLTETTRPVPRLSEREATRPSGGSPRRVIGSIVVCAAFVLAVGLYFLLGP